MITEVQVRAAIKEVLPDNVRAILVAGIRRGLTIFQEGKAENRNRLGFFAQNRETRDIFSSLCRGLELQISDSKTLLLQYNEKQVTSSYYIEIFNSNLLIHVRNEKSAFPQYMREKCMINNTFCTGKQNYCAISFPGEQGEILSSIDFIVYDKDGNIVFRELLDSTLQNINIA